MTGLKQINERCWIDKDAPEFSIIVGFDIKQEKVIYRISNGKKYVCFAEDNYISESQLYDRIFLPGKRAIEAQESLG